VAGGWPLPLPRLKKLKLLNLSNRGLGKAHAAFELVLLFFMLRFRAARPLNQDMAAIRAAPMSVPRDGNEKVRTHVSDNEQSDLSLLSGETGDLPITAPALAPGLRDLRAERTAAAPVAFVLPPVVHVVIGGAVRAFDFGEDGTSPRAPKPGKNAKQRSHAVNIVHVSRVPFFAPPRSS